MGRVVGGGDASRGRSRRRRAGLRCGHEELHASIDVQERERWVLGRGVARVGWTVAAVVEVETRRRGAVDAVDAGTRRGGRIGRRHAGRVDG